ncbi:MAG: hypothetical protein EBZ48_07055 [Proteobacteria bacterium]|nr:hypothetical protein [Pseudomonadota bacterium]
MPRTFRELDFIISLGLFLASSAVAVLAYASIQRREAPAGVMLSNLAEGTHSSRILMGDSCPGDITTTVLHDSVWLIRSSGKFQSFYGKSPINLSFAAEANFNPLGQLQSGQLQVNSDTVGIVVKLADANPIFVTLEKTLLGKTSTSTISVPGPILISTSNSPHEFQITYPNGPFAQNPSVKALQGFLAHELQLSFVDSAQAPALCRNPDAQRLDLLPLIIRMQSLLPPLVSASNEGSTRVRR